MLYLLPLGIEMGQYRCRQDCLVELSADYLSDALGLPSKQNNMVNDGHSLITFNNNISCISLSLI